MALDGISSTQKFKGLSTDTKPTQNVQAMSLFIETDTGSVFEYSGTSWKQISASGAALVIQGVVGTAQNRNINAASSTYNTTTNTATWAAPGVTQITIAPQVTTTQGALQNSQACLVVYDAPDAATASTWLSDAGSASTDVQYDMVFTGETLTRRFTTGVTRVDVLPIGTGNSVMRVVLGAV